MSKEFKIGLVVTSAIFMLYWGANFLNGNDIFSPDNAIYARYKNLDGLTSSSGVNYKGMQVGSVKGIEFDSAAVDSFCWVVKFDISTDGINLKDSCVAEIASADLLGTMVVDLTSIGRGKRVLEPGDTINGVLSKSLQDKVDERLRPLQKKIDLLVNSADSLIGTFVTVMDDKTQNNIKRSFEQIPSAIANIHSATKSVDSILLDLKNAKLNKILSNVADLSSTLKRNSETLTSIIENVDNITDSLAKAEIKQTVLRVNDVLVETETILGKINEGKGTMGMLINDKELYEHLVLASADLDFLLLDLKQNPGRYLNLSLMNFGSKRQKEASKWDSTDYSVLRKNLTIVEQLNDEVMGDLAKALRDSCGSTPCDSSRVRKIIEGFKE